MDNRLKILSTRLFQERYITADQLAGELGVSAKTVRNLLKDLDGQLSAYEGKVESKSGSGYRITFQMPESGQAFFNSIKETAQSLRYPENTAERGKFLLEYLIALPSYIKLDDLSQALYISKRTLTADLKETEKLLSRYQLKLVRRPNHGIRIEGKEFDLRRCMAEMLEESTFAYSKEMDHISFCVSQILTKYDFEMSNMAFQNLIVHIVIALQRIEEGHLVASDSLHPNSRQLPECQISKEITVALSKTYSIPFSDAEILYIAIQLAGKRLIMPEEGSSQNLVITQETIHLVSEMLNLVYEAFKFDFRNDLELRIALYQHIVPLCTRLKYHMVMKNPLLEDIKKRFLLPYTMAAQAVTVLNRKYETRLSDDEIGYIALVFALALERRRTRISKKNVLLVCASGRGSAQLLLYKYRTTFGPYINELKVADVGSLDKIDFSKIDYVISTVPIPVKIPVPIQEVQYFLEEEDIATVKKCLSHEQYAPLLQYYEEEMFLPHLNCKSKEEALQLMCQFVIEKKSLSQTFYESVLEREYLAKTAFGNMVAMPHPYRAMSQETFVCVGILDEPIDWGEEKIQVIFLVSIADRNQTSTELQNFYQMTSSFLLDKKNIQDLIKKRDYDWFIEEMGKEISENNSV